MDIKINKRTLTNMGWDLKYDCPGIYGIWIEEELVYIGKSKNMLDRIIAHIRYILKPREKEEKKYKEMRAAAAIKFDVLLYTKIEELDQKEAELIWKFKPRLNTVYPKLEKFENLSYNIDIK